MIVKLIILLIFLFALIVAVHAQKTVDGVNRGVVNGAATYLPKPDYPQEAKDFCIGGKVEIEVLIGENGNVIKAKAISGDELLRDISVEAVKKAKFGPFADGVPVEAKGIVVYNFPLERKCISGGIVNKRALSLPEPHINPGIKIKQEIIVKVGVIIDESGKVVFAKVLTDIHPLLRTAFENAARQAKFPYTNDVGRIRIKGYIVYKLKLNGKVET